MTTPFVLFMAVLGFLTAGMVLVYQTARIGVWCASKLVSGVTTVIKYSLGFLRDEALEAVQTAGALLSGIAITPLALGNLVIGRWSSAKHYGRALREEGLSGATGLYRLLIANPLRFLGLGSVINRVENKLPELVRRAPRHELRSAPLVPPLAARPQVEPPPLGGARGPRPKPAPGQANPSTQHSDTFEGYAVTGELPAGGSGARLFLARPEAVTVQRLQQAGLEVPGQVVIKSFAIAAGSTLPQIVREGRALESARRLGLVLQHSLDEERFWYVMPYVRGRELGDVSTSLHARSGPEGLDKRALRQVASYTNDVLASLTRFHEDGLWHKDVKPSNVMVADDVAHLVDLGLVTPLASAMTLTTHGTEYYRDPELVRQALRGAKVNEVDGVKFDLYAVGALLYSMIENSFPAHGSLSRITKRCPEALAFIQRRAMADLSDRYGSAEEMRADLALLLAAKDPFAVMPAELPSFRRAMTEDSEFPVPGRKHAKRSRTLRTGTPPSGKGQTHPVEAAASARTQDAEALASSRAALATLDPEPKQRRRSRQGLATFGLMFLALLALLKILPTVIENSPYKQAERNKQLALEQRRMAGLAPELDERTWEDSAMALAEAEQEEQRILQAHWRKEFPHLFEPGTARRLGPDGQDARILVLGDTSQSADDSLWASLAVLLEQSDFQVFGSAVNRVDSEESIELEAAARHALGLAVDPSPQALGSLHAFLEQQADLDAVLWTVSNIENQSFDAALILQRGEPAVEVHEDVSLWADTFPETTAAATSVDRM